MSQKDVKHVEQDEREKKETKDNRGHFRHLIGKVDFLGEAKKL